ncbi:MAG: 5'-3' exonuclease H3TH domain-containing protein, partial [Bacteroidota bacterium]
MAKQKVFLLDAMALLYRAHFAFIKNPRITSKGLDTSAIFGFTNTLLEIINKENPSHLAVAFDTSAPTFRHIAYEPYKAQREAMPEALATAIPYAYQLLKALDVPALKLDGYEADDIIGTISAAIDETQFEVYMVTPDKDYAQLVKDNVFLYKPAFRGGGFDVMGKEEVEAKFGLPPSQIIDFLGLKGDAVDNIPGIPKIGDKTAVSLLKEYGSVENIIANADNITKKSIQKTVKEHSAQGLMSKELATIKLDVPIEWSIEALALGHCDLETLTPLLQEFEFKKTAQRILNSRFNPMRPEQQKDLFGNETGEGAQFELPTQEAIKTIEDGQQSYHLLDGAEARQQLIAQIQAAKVLCFDTETTGLDPLLAEIVGASFSTKTGEGFFLYFPPEQSKEEITAILKEFEGVLTDPEILKIGQNLKYDLLVFKNYAVEVAGPMFDTMLAHYVINPGGTHNMDALAEEFLNYRPVSITSLIGPKGRKQKT